jgi:hypothetical protein
MTCDRAAFGNCTATEVTELYAVRGGKICRRCVLEVCQGVPWPELVDADYSGQEDGTEAQRESQARQYQIEENRNQREDWRQGF